MLLPITVNDISPAGLSYALNPATYTRGQAIAPNPPSSVGGTVVSFSVAPALPAGLSLSSSTGVISGVPSVIAASAAYTVTAVNSGGAASVVVSITVNDVAPSSLIYVTNPSTYSRGQAIVANSPSAAGGPVVSYAVAPALPAGLLLSSTTGVISGTPTVISAASAFTVTATNSGGSASATLSITVTDWAPSALSYPLNPATYTRGQAVNPNVPSSSGGAVTQYAVSPALPPGLALDGTTGVISGTPTSVAGAAAYAVTASNSGGSTSVSVNIRVVEVAPSALTYSSNPSSYVRNQVIAPNSPSSAGGPVATWAIAPALPAGLSLNTSTGVISGTPTALAAAASYTVTGSNSGGSTTASLSIAVIEAAPLSLTYATNPVTSTRGQALASNSPSNGGGLIASYAVTPALPAGLTLNASTGVVSGTPTTLSPSADYTVTGTNTGGSTTVVLTITVNDTPPSGLSYATNPATYVQGQAIAPNSPTSAGGAVTSYTIAPALPTGLTLNATTGVITGVPTAPAATASHTITAQNSGGSTQANLSITVTAPPPPPMISVQPQSLTVQAATTAIFRVTASGSGSLSYAWFRNGAALPGATASSYMTPILTTTSSGDLYYVVVSDGFGGSTSSTSATLTVTPGTFTSTGSMTTSRWLHRATVLPSGKVFITGGDTASAELFDPSTGVFTATTTMARSRRAHTATLLLNGMVLVTGGSNPTTGYVAHSELYDPSTALWSPVTLTAARGYHTATRLQDGRVLITGGVGPASILATAEIFDPATNLSTVTGSMSMGREGHAAILLPNGKVLITGGRWATNTATGTAELFDPATGTFSLVSSVMDTRADHAMVLLSTGRVLVIGGVGSSPSTSVDEFNPATATFSSLYTLNVGRAQPTVLTLPGGRLLVLDGYTQTTSEVFDPARGMFFLTGSLGRVRRHHAAAVLNDGRVLIMGGHSDVTPVGIQATAEIYR